LDSNKKKKKDTLKTAEMNYMETIKKYPETEEMFNMSMKNVAYDPFDKDPHRASRMINESSPV